MTRKKNIDTANEPVDQDDEGIVDTGVLHEKAPLFPDVALCEDPDCPITLGPHQVHEE